MLFRSRKRNARDPLQQFDVGRPGTLAVSAAQASRVAGAARDLLLFAVVAHRGLQGIAHSRSVAGVLSRFAEPGIRERVRSLPSTLLYEHSTQLVAGAAFSICGAQRRDQYHRREPALDAGEGALVVTGAGTARRGC